nr:MAG TPA: hypothetical protein [Caudoviricetes sp.]
MRGKRIAIFYERLAVYWENCSFKLRIELPPSKLEDCCLNNAQ